MPIHFPLKLSNATLSFGGRHVKRLPKGIRGGFDVVGIDQQGSLQLPGSAGKLTENEHA